MVIQGAIPYSTAPKSTPEMDRQHELHWAVRDKKLTLEQAKAQGYKEPDNDLWGLSGIPLDGEK